MIATHNDANGQPVKIEVDEMGYLLLGHGDSDLVILTPGQAKELAKAILEHHAG